jgi:hypothetical protein
LAFCATNAQKRAKLKAEAKVSRAEAEKMLKLSCCFISIAAASLLVSCASYKARTEAESGGDFLFRLHQKGQLPGDTKDDHGKVTCYLSPRDLEQLVYPLSRTYQVVKKGDSSTNNYTVVRLTKHSPWQLQRAWRTDSQGRVTEEWAVK